MPERIEDPKLGIAPRRRISPWWVGVAVGVLLVLLASILPSPYAIARPGPVVDAFGSIETEAGAQADVIRIEGAKTYPTSGALNVLSVTISGTPDRPADWLGVAGALLDPTRAVVPLADLFPDGVTADDRAEQNAAMMRASQQAATAAALNRAGVPVAEKLSVAEVVADGPAAGKLEAGDVIRSADGKEVSGLAELRRLLSGVPEGGSARIGFERKGETREADITPETAADGTRLLGITVNEEFSFPFDVQLDLDTIGGPSAGLIFALAIYDKLTPGELTGGHDISGTGTIDAEGRVGAIGGLPQKIWGASLAGSTAILIPVDNCADLPDRLPDGMIVAPVETLDEAVAAIEAIDRGEKPAGVQRCEAVAAAARR